MVWSNVRFCAVLELLVILFQVAGVVSLAFSRLAVSARCVERGRLAFIASLFGLGIAGALCGRHDSEFALFAGGTMTLLLIGMTAGGGAPDITGTSGGLAGAEGSLAG